jgi:PAS domain S-box-containing protein
MRMGAYDYLQKPIKPELLIQAVNRGLEKKQLKDLTEAVIKKMDEGIALLDSEGLIDFVSDRFCEISNHTSEELMGNLFLSIVSPEDEYATTENFRQARQGNPQRFQASIIRKDGKELIAIISLTKVGNRILTVISDVTKIIGPPVFRRDLMYKIRPGSVYLVTEENLSKSMSAFIELLSAGFLGLLITRNHPNEIKSTWNADVPVLWLTDDVVGESTIFPNVALVERKLHPYVSRNRVILIDRLDYLISRNSFETVLGLVQRLNDLVFMRKSVLLLSVDPRTLTERQFSLLEKETSPLLPSSKMNLPEDLSELLIYVAQRNEVGEKPFHKELEKKFDITRTTVRKRLRLLREKGLIVERKKGRMKVVEITERGRKMIR